MVDEETTFHLLISPSTSSNQSKLVMSSSTTRIQRV
uniref:Uncharacterized protein n=1 Tax=Brassica campestris TaxID=3711 RepID=A0A3P6BYV6_BRACM|nr:unnamed protein product [Brassica rapa]